MSSELVSTGKLVSKNASLAERIAAHRRSVGTFLLLDCSGSMSDRVGEGRAIDKLRKIARQLRIDAPNLRQVVFPSDEDNDSAVEIFGDIPEPRGTTPLAEAITYGASLGAVHLIIVSDGAPNNPDAAHRAAEKARCRIDVFFVGRAGDFGEAFLRELARRHGGSCDTVSLGAPAQLETKIRGLLSA